MLDELPITNLFLSKKELGIRYRYIKDFLASSMFTKAKVLYIEHCLNKLLSSMPHVRSEHLSGFMPNQTPFFFSFFLLLTGNFKILSEY